MILHVLSYFITLNGIILSVCVYIDIKSIFKYHIFSCIPII